MVTREPIDILTTTKLRRCGLNPNYIIQWPSLPSNLNAELLHSEIGKVVVYTCGGSQECNRLLHQKSDYGTTGTIPISFLVEVTMYDKASGIWFYLLFPI